MMPAIPSRTKRIVFVERDGLHRICGTDGALAELPVTVENVPIGGRVVEFVNLYRVTKNAAYYRAPVTMGSTFHAAQR